LADVTNSVPSRDPNEAGKKSEDKEKWWSIIRGQKESKDLKMVEKENS
jgi:hypothetical protein